MKRLLALLLLAAPLLAQTPTPTPTPTVTPTRTPTPTPTMTPTRTPTPYLPARYSLATQVKPGFGTPSTEPTLNKLGDMFYATDFRTFGRLAGNTSATPKVLISTGSGTVATAPAWGTLTVAMIPSGLSYVTSVGNGTIGGLFSASWATATTTPAFSLNLASQSANCVIAGPSSGGSAVPTCRSLVTADFPTSGVSAATYGDSTHVAQCAFDATGRATSCSNVAISASSGVSSLDSITGAITLVAGSNITITDNSPGAGQITIASSGGSGFGGQLWILADPGFSVGSSYERANYALGGYGLVQLAPTRTFAQTVANCKTSPGSMAGNWSWVIANTNLSSCDTNTTTSGALHLVHDNTNTDQFFGGTRTAPMLARTYESGSFIDVIARIANVDSEANFGLDFILMKHGNSGYHIRTALNNGGLFLQSDDNGTGANNTIGSVVSGAYNGNGAWFRYRKVGTHITVYYSNANQATPPTTWTTGINFTLGALAGNESVDIGFSVNRAGATSGNRAGDILYFDDTIAGILAPWQMTNTADRLIGASGFDSSSPVLTLVAGFDLGASGATVTDANARLALAEITNPRSFDSATWTWSVSRGSSAPVSCGGGTYAAAASVSIGGTGRYLSVCGKAASTSREQPGSVNAVGLRIPFTP